MNTADDQVQQRANDDAIEMERLRRQRARSIAIAVSLVLLVVLFYIATLIKMGGSVAEKAGS